MICAGSILAETRNKSHQRATQGPNLGVPARLGEGPPRTRRTLAAEFTTLQDTNIHALDHRTTQIPRSEFKSIY